jgi:DMSO/TMAO reductase YedYZ molybdopterin-dependent catalytic subunit
MQSKIICAFLLLVGLMGCQPQVANEQLEQWHQEAIAENKRLTKAYASNLSEKWIFRIQGQVKKPITLNWTDIQKRSTAKITSVKPHPGSSKKPIEFSGISVKSILEEAGIDPDAEDVTIVASDAYYDNIKLKHLYASQAVLAIAEDGRLIRRDEGGPIHLVFDRSSKVDPEALSHQTWVFYVTHLIVGTEPLRLKIEKTTLEREDIEKLPTHTISVLVGYKLAWPSEPVQLVGVKIRDILRSQNVTIPAGSILKVRRKSMDGLDPQKYVRIPAKLIDECDVMLAYQWGADSKNIPAQKGGPLTLAYGNNCPDDIVKSLAWLTFVESMSVESAEEKS